MAYARDVLHLAAPTDPGWAPYVLASPDVLLLDHAHCERKAAATARSLVRRCPEHAFLATPLRDLAREEEAHFELLCRKLAARGVAFRGLRAAPYASRLRAALRPTGRGRVLDMLLCSALIEARSCERFRLLAQAAADLALGALYRGLLASEARHHHVLLALAERVAPAADVGARLRELARHEAAVIAGAPPLVRMHGGVPAQVGR